MSGGAAAASAAAQLAGDLSGTITAGIQNKKLRKKVDALLQEDAAAYLPILMDLGLVDDITEYDPASVDAWRDIATDPRLIDEEMSQLDALSKISKEGMTAVDRAAANQLMSDVMAQARGQREALEAQAARRGMLGSGLSMGLQAQVNQDAAQRAALAGLAQAQQAQNRRMQGIQGAAGLAGQMGTRQFGQQFQQQQAASDIQRFNEAQRAQMERDMGQARLGAYQQNVGARTQAAQYAADAENQKRLAALGTYGGMMS